ncbi:transporter [Steroidobacter agaridevorans]|uniref:Transporter n=1 Tax=Steroidobacter agaridevorans TaxID=2695856 RepID=A0A829YG97_9GAMM|nr:VirB4 family type IV secretion/conjugal transfer ATPase [Steroidobacter agaridevorans]GFE82475.1 transporter [Steroidobacter agaridevorans]
MNAVLSGSRSREAIALRCRLDPAIAARIPYCAHVAPEVVSTHAGDYVQAIRLTGISHETADDITIRSCHERLNVLLRSIASPKLALWTHVIRRRIREYPEGECRSLFARMLDTRYRARIEGEKLYVNELYVALVYRPLAGIGQGVLGRLISRSGSQNVRHEREDSLDACAKVRAAVLAALVDYEPATLGIYLRGAQPYSELLEYFSTLLTASSQLVPLPRGPLSNALGFVRPLIGAEAMEFRGPTHTRLGAMLGIKEYAARTGPYMFDGLLRAPMEFIFTQSFTFLTQAAGQAVISHRAHQFTSSGDYAESQGAELYGMLDAYASGEFVLGDHHASFLVLSDVFDGVDVDAARRLKQLNDRIADSLPLLQSSHMIMAREDLALESAYWAQLPGCFADRPRKAPVSSRNFCGMAPLHGFPAGRLIGNRWGAALAVFPTPAGTPFYFSLHSPDASGDAGDNGHVFVCGPTGSGKTVFLGFVIAALQKFGVTQIVIDKDRGLQLLVRALDGEYLALYAGCPTGFNPLQLPPTPANVDFLRQWLLMLGEPRNVQEETDLYEALRGTLALPEPDRKLSRLIEFLDSTEPGGVWLRMTRWCASQRGEYAWVFDNDADLLLPRLGAPDLLGIDVTAILNHPLIRTPVAAYLLHLIAGLLDGRRLVCFLEEFSSLLNAPVFAGLARDGLRGWRKLEGNLVLCAQSPHDVVQSEIAHTLVEGVGECIYFPNANGAREDYVEKFGCTEREFALIREGMVGARQFLVKQARGSVVCSLDLRGFNEELTVISGRARTVAVAEALMREIGNSSDQWLPAFLDRVRAGDL